MAAIKDDALVQPIKVTVTRGTLVESVHLVDAVVVDGKGNVLAAAGRPEVVTYWRSSAKPFQALPLVRQLQSQPQGERHELRQEEIAVMCASHSGEEEHVRVVESLLRRFELDETHLRCGAHPPLHEPSARNLWQSGAAPRPIHNNCSGKHAGMLVHTKLTGASLESYWDPGHPVQLRILEAVAAFSGVPADEVVLGVDGCGAPVFALPLVGMATAYARLVAPENHVDAESARAARTIAYAMRQKPFFVAGSGRLCTGLMEALAPWVVAKGGAEGVYCVGLLEKGWGVALKVRDGAARATGPAVIEILAALGVVSPAAEAALAGHRRPVVRNVAGLEVGRIQAELPSSLKEALRLLV